MNSVIIGAECNMKLGCFPSFKQNAFFGYLLPCGPRCSFTGFPVWAGESDLQGHQAWWVCMVNCSLCFETRATTKPRAAKCGNKETMHVWLACAYQ